MAKAAFGIQDLSFIFIGIICGELTKLFTTTPFQNYYYCNTFSKPYFPVHQFETETQIPAVWSWLRNFVNHIWYVI